MCDGSPLQRYRNHRKISLADAPKRGFLLLGKAIGLLKASAAEGRLGLPGTFG